MTTSSDSVHAPHTVLVAGASGALGELIVQALVDAGGHVRAGMRGGTAHPKADALASIDGVEVVDLDLERPDTLARAAEGTEVVISTVQGGPDVIVDGQEALAKAAQSAGVRRMFPSDFGMDATGIPEGAHLFQEWRREGQKAIAATGLAQTNTFNGAFMEMLLPQKTFPLMYWDTSQVRYWGDAEKRYDFTSMEDTASFVAAASLNPSVPDGPLRIAGDRRSPAELAEIAARVYGRTFTAEHLGTLEELDEEIDRRQATSPEDPMEWAGLLYLRAMGSGTGTLRHLDNDDYPSVVPMGVAEFLEGVRS